MLRVRQDHQITRATQELVTRWDLVPREAAGDTISSLAAGAALGKRGAAGAVGRGGSGVLLRLRGPWSGSQHGEGWLPSGDIRCLPVCCSGGQHEPVWVSKGSQLSPLGQTRDVPASVSLVSRLGLPLEEVSQGSQVEHLLFPSLLACMCLWLSLLKRI